MEDNINAIKNLNDMSHVLQRGRTTTILCAERYLNEFLSVRVVEIDKRLTELDNRRSQINHELFEITNEKTKLQEELVRHSKLMNELKAEIKAFI